MQATILWLEKISYPNLLLQFIWGITQVPQQISPFELARVLFLKSCGILHQISIRVSNVEMILDFYIFDTPDFDILIGQPLESLFEEPPTTGAKT